MRIVTLADATNRLGAAAPRLRAESSSWPLPPATRDLRVRSTAATWNLRATLHPSAKELPPPKEGLNGVVHVVYPYAWLDDVLAMLRLEKPIFFTWNAEARIARVTTEDEPVGEEEHRSFLEFLAG